MKQIIKLALPMISVVLLFVINQDVAGLSGKRILHKFTGHLQAEATPAYENPPVFKASELLQPDKLRGPHYQVEEDVVNDGYLNNFKINSDFGTFDAHGYTMLHIRLQELDALARLQEVSKSEEFAKALARSAIKPLKGAAGATRRPVATVKGVPGGVKRLFDNLSHDVKQGIKEVREDKGGDGSKSTQEEIGGTAKNAAEDFFGVTSAERRWAQKLGVDPYSSNEVLNKELEHIGWVDAAGDLAKSFVLPSIPGVGIAAEVNDLVWGKDPQELRKINEDRLFKMGVGTVLRSNFLENHSYTPTLQTRLVASLFAMEDVDDRESFIQMAIRAENESEARFYQQSAEFLSVFHNSRQKFKYLIPDLQVAAGKTTGGDIIVLLPVDYLVWTSEFHATEEGIRKQCKNSIGEGRFQIWLTGKVSSRTRKELTTMGWLVNEDRYKQLQ